MPLFTFGRRESPPKPHSTLDIILPQPLSPPASSSSPSRRAGPRAPRNLHSPQRPPPYDTLQQVDLAGVFGELQLGSPGTRGAPVSPSKPPLPLLPSQRTTPTAPPPHRPPPRQHHAYPPPPAADRQLQRVAGTSFSSPPLYTYPPANPCAHASRTVPSTHSSVKEAPPSRTPLPATPPVVPPRPTIFHAPTSPPRLADTLRREAGMGGSLSSHRAGPYSAPLLGPAGRSRAVMPEASQNRSSTATDANCARPTFSPLPVPVGKPLPGDGLRAVMPRPSPSSSSASKENEDDSFRLSLDSQEDEDDLPSPATLFGLRPQNGTSPPSSAAAKLPRKPQPRSVSSPFPTRPSPPNPSDSPPPFSSPASEPRSRRSSPSKASSMRQVRCSGTTQSGSRCSRTVSFSPLPVSRSPSPGQAEDGDDLDVELEEDRYCRQHQKAALVETGCFLRVRGGGEDWIEFADWISPSLPSSTQALLRGLMRRPISPNDKPGYIYLHELLPRSSAPAINNASYLFPLPAFPPPPESASPSSSALTILKLGRALRPSLRLAQWRSSCPSVEVIVRGVYPLHPTPVDSPSTASVSLQFALQGSRHHHRLERLCLVELAGRQEALLDALGAEGARWDGQKGDGKCLDCGRKHQECFLIPRAAFGAGAEGGWAVREVVERWQRWTDEFVE